MEKQEKQQDKKQKVAFDAKRGTVFYIDPEALVVIEDKDHPLYDPRIEMALKESFVLSIKARGVIEPVVIRKNGAAPEVVDGRQRVRAAREANRRLKAEGATPISVPCVQWRGDDGEAFETAILLNEQREDDSPLAKAQKANALLKKGRTEKQIADEVFGVTPATIKAWVGLLDLHPKVQAAVEEGTITATTAVGKLGKLSREDQIKALEELGSNGSNGKDREHVRRVVEKHGGKAGAKPLPGKKQLRRLVDIDLDSDERNVLTPRERAIIGWITGDASEGKVGEAIPGFLPLLRRAERAPSKREKHAANAE